MNFQTINKFDMKKMNILKDLFLFKKPENNKILNHGEVDHYKEIAKVVKESRIQKNCSANL